MAELHLSADASWRSLSLVRALHHRVALHHAAAASRVAQQTEQGECLRNLRVRTRTAGGHARAAVHLHLAARRQARLAACAIKAKACEGSRARLEAAVQLAAPRLALARRASAAIPAVAELRAAAARVHDAQRLLVDGAAVGADEGAVLHDKNGWWVWCASSCPCVVVRWLRLG
eukprot:CAMPEP_0119421032 /NCGR_PEP_ID=MMETSP1335-20130426/24913_1 /TAXON_ID=259385 /ORGANISM="Chrysoculter rhomboideus, Strain RCC1486" /LENGTH=173 /DNA_ID=CAMNT_0007446417 /DNA_START=116 /DNA_END=633 /DNA_ORIENTATION=-